MINYPNIDPVALSLGPLQIHWYGVMYLIGFAAAWWLGNKRAARPGSGWKSQHIEDLIFFGALGTVLGGRMGYVLFYNFPAFVDDPLMLFKIWQGGMSFHGGLLGGIVSMWFFAGRHNKSFFEVIDFAAPLIPIGLGAGRIGNFINAELWGKVSDVPWAMVFPGGGPLARHPSQLYQFALEGVALFLIVWLYSSKPRPTMAISGLFIISYSVFRILIEFIREPDAHLGYLAFGWLTMGQILSLPLLAVGIVLMVMAYKKAASEGL